MGPPTLWMRFRQTLGRALRETGQAVDRLGIRTQQLFLQERRYGDDDPFIYDDFLSRHRQQMPLLKYGRPLISSDVAYLAPCVTMIGSVRVGANSSIWYKAVLRADQCENGSSFGSEKEGEMWDLNPDRFISNQNNNGVLVGGGIFIGENTNVQDAAIITSRVGHTIIGDGVTIGHLAQIHSAEIEDHCLIGMGSVIQEGCKIETEAFIAAGALLPPNTIVKSGELWAGIPARKLRDLTAEQRKRLHYQADEYVTVAKNQSGVMELGGNMPEDMGTRLALVMGTPTEEDLPAIESGNHENEMGATRELSARQLSGKRRRSPARKTSSIAAKQRSRSMK